MKVYSSFLSKIKKRKSSVLVIGLGYVGLPLIKLISKKGFRCNGLDVNKTLISQLQLDKSLSKINFNYKYEDIDFENIDIVIIALPTPLKSNREPDLSYINSAVNKINNKRLKNSLIILESTSYPTTTDDHVVKKFIKNFNIGKNIFIAYSPERVDPGNSKYNIENTPKIVSGYTKNCKILVNEFYKKVCKKIVLASSLEHAEMAKLYENIFRSVNIGLANETKNICLRLGLDFNEILKLSSTKPFGFMPFYSGPGVGGHCIPVDPFYLSWFAKKKKINTKFIKLAGDINDNEPHNIVKKFQKILKEKSIKKTNKILILGLSYKKNISDVRNSPSLEIYKKLKDLKYNLDFNDNYVKEIKFKNKIFQSVKLKNYNKYKIILLLTDHDYYKKLKFLKNQIIIDTRNYFLKYNNIFNI